MKKLVLSLLGAFVGFAAVPAQAITSFSLENPTCAGATAPTGTSSCVFGNGVTLSAVGTGNQVAGTLLGSITLEYYGNNSGSYGAGAGGGWGAWSGADPGAPYHALDNNGKYEMFLLTFNQKVSLNTVQMGWNGSDNAGLGSDISVLAFTGAANPAPFPGASDTWGSLTGTWNGTTGGWTAVGNYANVGLQTNNTQNIQTINQGTKNAQTQATSEVFSSYWLIGAYNPLAITNPGPGGVGLNPQDTFKLLGVTGCTETETNNKTGGAECTRPGNKVPEPGSLALFGLAMVGAAAMRRRVAR